MTSGQEFAAIGTRFSSRSARGIGPGVPSEVSFSEAAARLCRSGVSITRFLMAPFLYIHGLVRLRHQFTKGDGALRIKRGDTNTERQFVTRFAGIELLEALFQAAEEDFLGLASCFRCQHDKFISADTSQNIGITESMFQGVRSANQCQISLQVAIGVIDFLQIVEVAIQK